MPLGGVARRATIIQQERTTEEHVLVLDAGDALIRDQAPATRTQGKSSIEIMNMLGYDAMALGEGDLGMLGVDTILERQQEAHFAFLSANAYMAGTDNLLVEPYVLRQVGESHIAIIGITGQVDLEGIEIREPVPILQRLVGELRNQAEILILLSHTGMGINRAIARAVPELDLIISGGGAEYAQSPQFTQGGPVLVQADVSTPGHAGRRIGVGLWTFAGGTLLDQNWSNIAISPDLAVDEQVSRWVAENP